MEQTKQENIAETLARTIKDPVNIKVADNSPVQRVALPPGWTMQDFNDESHMPAPARKKGTIELHEMQSFISYISMHMMIDITNIYCIADYLNSIIGFQAIINDHGGEDDPQWRDHIAKYSPQFSEEWNRWTGSNGTKFSQIEFAMFIEDNLQDIAAVDGMPNGTQILEMATSFEANQDLRFKSAIRLQNGGVQMSFVQDDDDQTLVKMQMFERIALGIPVFWNGEPYQLDARLKYRVREGRALFWYELIRPDKIIEDATKYLIEKIKTETGAPFYFGCPL